MLAFAGWSTLSIFWTLDWDSTAYRAGIATEGLGFFEPGTGGLAAEKGWTSLGGRLPVNPSGGLKAKGHPIGATGAAQIAEIVTQLRGEAGPRQVDGASTGLTHTLGGNTATVLVSLFGRD